MSKLSAYLKPAEDLTATKEVVISNRFKDEKGEIATIEIKVISQKENEALLKRCTRTKKDKGTAYETLDRVEYQARLIQACVVDPDFADSELCKAYGVVDPLSLPATMFLPGEYAKLATAITDFNGFEDDEEIDEEAKN